MANDANKKLAGVAAVSLLSGSPLSMLGGAPAADLLKGLTSSATSAANSSSGGYTGAFNFQSNPVSGETGAFDSILRPSNNGLIIAAIAGAVIITAILIIKKR